MCSVRHRPTPSAPSSSARAASAPVSAFARTPRCPRRISSAHPSTVANSSGVTSSVVDRSPAITSPVAPSIEMRSPSRTMMSPTENDRPSITIASAPTTAGVPHPRATIAVWLTRPPRAVSRPSAAIIPCTSAGVVSLATRITRSPRSAASAASSALKYTLPTAAPGDTPSPVTRTTPVSSNRAWITASRSAAVSDSNAASRVACVSPAAATDVAAPRNASAPPARAHADCILPADSHAPPGPTGVPPRRMRR